MSVKKNQPGVIFVVSVILIDAITFGIVLPVLPHLICVVSDTSLSDAARLGGYLTLGYAFLQFFSAPILGNLSDKYGRRPILLFTKVYSTIQYYVGIDYGTFFRIGRLDRV